MDDRAERKRGELLMATYLTDSSDLTSVANAIRTKGGTSAQMAFPAGFVSAVQNIQTGITPTGTKQISITDNGTTTEDVAAYANAEITVNVQGGGGGSDSLVELCNGTLTTYESDDVINISTGVFRSYPALTSIKIKNCVNLGAYALGGTHIASIVLPKYTGQSNQGQCFNGCSMLTAADLGASTTSGVRIPGGFFAAASALKTIVLRYSSLIALYGTNAFNATPFASNGTGGTLYVPSALISSYQSATNWSTILGYANNEIKSIESTHTDPDAPIDLTLYYADGTAIPSA